MATSIRLTRMGRKQAPFYRIVVCDSRTRRDGDYIENLGYYNPMPDAYELSVDHDKTVAWLDKGAQPTDTAKSLLRTEGVLYRWHLTKDGTSLEEIETKVEEFRSRRSKQSEAIKAKSKADIEAQHDSLQKAADEKKKAIVEAAAKAEADQLAAAAAAAAEVAATAEAETAETAEADTTGDKTDDAKTDDDSATEETPKS